MRKEARGDGKEDEGRKNVKCEEKRGKKSKKRRKTERDREEKRKKAREGVKKDEGRKNNKGDEKRKKGRETQLLQNPIKQQQ